MAEELINVRTFMKHFFFLFVFIVSFVLMLKPEIELFGMSMFFAINFLFCLFTANDMTSGSLVLPKGPEGTEQSIKLGILLTTLAFSFVSTIFMVMTLSTLQRKFATNNSGIKLSPRNREDLDKTKIIFIAATVMIGVLALYVYYSADQVHKLVYFIFNTILNGREIIWMRVLFPIAILGVGAALYGQLTRDKILVNKKPEQFCYPGSDENLSSFRENFINAFWILVSYVILVLLRPLIESSYGFGWLTGSSGSRRAAGNKYGDKENKFDDNINKGASPYLFGINPGIKIPGPSFVNWLYGSGMKLTGIVLSRWDVFYQLAVYGLSIAGLVFASLSLRDFMGIHSSNHCLMREAFIRQLYIAFIFFVVVLYSINTFSTFQITTVLTGVMRYFVPPTALALTSYLVYITNEFSKLSPQLLVE